MLNISSIFLSTIFLLCFYIDHIQLDELLFKNIKYIENEKVKLISGSIFSDGILGSSFQEVQEDIKGRIFLDEDDKRRLLRKYYEEAMVNRSMKYLYVLAYYGSMIAGLKNQDKSIENLSTAVYTISNFFNFIRLKNEVLINISNTLKNFKHLPKEPNSVSYFAIIPHVFIEILEIINNYFKGNRVWQYYFSDDIFIYDREQFWDMFKSVISENLENEYYPPTKIENKNQEVIEAMNILTANLLEEYKIILDAAENNEEKCKINNFIP